VPINIIIIYFNCKWVLPGISGTAMRHNSSHNGPLSIIIIIIITILVTFLDFLTPVVRGQRQTDAIYFDFSNAFDLVPHKMLLHKLSSFGLLKRV
jgi:hypothetical protein